MPQQLLIESQHGRVFWMRNTRLTYGNLCEVRRRRTAVSAVRRFSGYAALASTLPIQLRASVTSACDN